MNTCVLARRIFVLALLLWWGPIGVAAAEPIDLTRAVVVAPGGADGVAVSMLVDEVEARSRVRWTQATAWPAEAAAPVIVVGRYGELERLATERRFDLVAPPEGKVEGYSLTTAKVGERWVVSVAGQDARGVLFGVGRLLRTLVLERDRVSLRGEVSVATAPHTALRGHQLGYRPKTNSYDAWDERQWERYIRDLVVFGCNAIELIPPRSDDDADSPHFPRPPLEMMRAMSGIAERYGLDVWLWYPALDEDYTDPKTMDFALREWGEVFAALPKVDAVFVPGGDPGKTPPKPLFELMEKQTANLRRYHPKAMMWFSPQGFDAPAFDEILRLVKEEPSWLGGLVFGPQVRMNLPELRRVVPAKFPIRFYPDITHSRSCQYPVPDWDRAFAATEGREVINPRPEDQAAILRLLGPLTNGFITYSEGCNDDVNKAVWSALGWDPKAEIADVLRDYARYYIGPSFEDTFAQGLRALEENWRGPAATNRGIEITLEQFQAMERAAGPWVRRNWRFQQALYRAYYDAYARRRLMRETELERLAMEALGEAPRIGAIAAMDRARAILDRAIVEPVSPDLKRRLDELAEALFQSIGMQLSVERYGAIAIGRGTSQDTIDRPLNDRPWLIERFGAIRGMESEADRLKAIEALRHRTDPGPGGFYDDLGSSANQPHLVRGLAFDQDPGSRESVLLHFDDGGGGPMAWRDHALGLYEQPVRLAYRGLDPKATYRVRAVYGTGPIRLMADGAHEVHGPLDRRYEPVEFEVPAAATADGSLELEFRGQAGRGGNGRTCAVAEVWLIRTGSR